MLISPDHPIINSLLDNDLNKNLTMTYTNDMLGA
jgi:hypothetical protein